MTDNIIKKIIEEKDKMSKKQKQFCEFVLDNYQNLEIYTISTMAEKSGVGTPTIPPIILFLNRNNSTKMTPNMT